MARVMVTGSSDGLGLMAARLLVDGGHAVVLHARSQARADDARRACPGAEEVLVGDLASLTETAALAEAANRSGRFDAVIHNAGVGYTRPAREESRDGHELHFAVNVLATYLLTARMQRPDRLVYLTSGMHRRGRTDLDDLEWKQRRWDGAAAYSDSKLADVLLAFGVARRWPEVRSNVVEPGWVATRMGGPGAPDDLEAGPVTQVWLAVSEDPEAAVTGGYWYHRRPREPLAATREPRLQDALLERCAASTGVGLPEA